MGLYTQLSLTPIQNDGRGCEHCPRNKVKGINKIMGLVKGRNIFIWTPFPGVSENAVEKELVGKAGQFLWKELARVGIERKDCDIQNVVRCMPAYKDIDGEWVSRDPTTEEIKCCSIYTDQAKQRSKAKIWIVLGKIAAGAMFGPRANNADKVFYHGPVKVFVLDHPSYFLKGAPKARLVQFRSLLDCVAQEITEPGKINLPPALRKTNYIKITTYKEALHASAALYHSGNEGKVRIAVDEEDDVIDGKEAEGRKILCVGFCAKPGTSYVFVLDHPDNKASKEDQLGVRKVVANLLKSPFRKAMHQGVHDSPLFAKLIQPIVNYDYDTRYAEFCFEPIHKSYAMQEIVNRRFATFIGYKDLVFPEAIPEGMTLKQAKEEEKLRFSKVPLDKLVLRNGADADITKRIELTTKNHVPHALVRAYTEAAFVLARMEKFGPLFDQKQCDRLVKIYPAQKEELLNNLRRIADSPDYNPNSVYQNRHLLYSTPKNGGFGFTPLKEGDTSTNKETLQLLQIKYKHPFIGNLQKYRGIKTIVERIEAFSRSAYFHKGRVTTYWNLTGAGTGRLSSGGGGKGNKNHKALGNLQNIPGNIHVKNILVSDLRWEELFAIVLRKEKLNQFQDTEFFVAADYCLTGDTLIKTVHGPKKIQDITAKDAVLSLDIKTRKLRFNRVQGGGIVGIKPVYKITFEDGSSVQATSEHKWRSLETDEWVKTSQLVSGSRLVHVKESKLGYKRKYRNWWVYSNRNWFYQHRLIAEYKFSEIPDEMDVDHKDHNPAHNTYKNIRLLSTKVNRGKSASRWWINATPEQRKQKSKSLAEGLRRSGCHVGINNSMYGRKHSDATKDLIRQRALERSKNHKVINVEYVGKLPVYQISVARDHNYVLDNGLVSKNSQNELRMIAQLTGEKELIRLFHEGRDIHASVGSTWSGWSFKTLQEDDRKRRIVKAFIFGVCFGLTAHGLWKDLSAEGIKISEEEVNILYKKFFKRFPGIRDFINDTVAFVEKHGYVENVFGFRVPIDIHKTKGGFWKNQAVNTPIQGGAHQILVCALALMQRERDKYRLIRPQLEIHDSFVTISKLLNLLETVKLLLQLMTKDVAESTAREFGIKWKIPFVADIKIGLRFGGLVKMKPSLKETIQAVVQKNLEQQKELTALERQYKVTKNSYLFPGVE